MTKKLLEQYVDILEEIEELNIEINSPVTDVVRGSLDQYPYTQHSLIITGVPHLQEKKRRLEELERQRDEIRAFIDALPTSKQRRIAQMRALQRLSWNEIATKMGYRYSPDSAKKKIIGRL